MSREVSEAEEYDALRAFAKRHGFYAQVHRTFSSLAAAPGREKACWYLMRAKKGTGEHEPTIIRYRTADEVYEWINEYLRQQREAPK